MLSSPPSSPSEHLQPGVEPPIIEVRGLCRAYQVPVREPGLGNMVRHFFQRQYRTIDAVKDVTFSIQPGEIVGFLGPNGAGKTTTLKMLSGLIHPSSGFVQVAGAFPFAREPSFLKSITLVMGQKEQLIWDLPALDALRINAAVYGLPDTHFQARLTELAGLLELQNKLDQPIRKLSLGERMKAELLAALLHRPQVLFLDEPTLGLDINAQVAIREFLQDYNRRTRATILLTSHYMADIRALCSRVLLIHQGRLIFDGGLQGLLEQFAPYREVRIDLEYPIEKSQLEAYGDVAELSARQARLLVQRPTLTHTIAKILAGLPVVDLTVTDPPIEDVIGRVFDRGSVG